MSRFQFIKQEHNNYPVDLLCRMLGVSPCRYYSWRKHQRQPAVGPSTQEWQKAMKEAFTYHKRCYGTRRLRAELHAQGHRVGRQRLRTAMRWHGLRAV